MSRARRDDMQRAIEQCEGCRDVCLRAVAYCLDRRGRHAEPSHVTALLDCVDACTTASNFMLRDSLSHGRACELCADVCDQCAESCERFPDDNAMRSCAAECRRCAASCRDMARSAAQNVH
ncbi:MAG TPA: four-helix bundle copper-binding protein [Vicinamibacterales bacterium]|nr:four-helix bundle copper-binding protein [Vicinamibacterales bacterium]